MPASPNLAQEHADRIVADPTTAPTTVDGRIAAAILGSSYWTLLATVRDETCPVPFLRFGRAIRFPTRPLLEAVGIHTTPPPDAELPRPADMGSRRDRRPKEPPRS